LRKDETRGVSYTSSMKKFVFPIIVVLLCCCIVGAILADYYRESPEVITASFVGREQCASCHQPQADAFHGSHHDKAMDIATDKSVLAEVYFWGRTAAAVHG